MQIGGKKAVMLTCTFDLIKNASDDITDVL